MPLAAAMAVMPAVIASPRFALWLSRIISLLPEVGARPSRGSDRVGHHDYMST